VTVKFGIKASSMLAGLALATVFVAGCTEEAPPEPAKPAPAAVSPAKPDMKAPAPAPTPEKK
jgi:outer membrane lipoprotein-sorting protein